MTLVGSYSPDDKEIAIEENRGFDNTDTNEKGMIIKADAEQLVQELSNRGIVQNWKQNIYESEITIAEAEGWVVYQLKDHKWSVIQQDTTIVRGAYFETSHVKVLSDWLQTKCMFYTFSDTAYTLVYQVYNSGNLLERCFFNTTSGTELAEMEVALSDKTFTQQETVEGEFDEAPFVFQSKLRPITTRFFDPEDCINLWLIKEEGYVPSIRWGGIGRRLQPGERHTISIRNLPLQKVRRMDYVTLTPGWEKTFTVQR